MPIDWKAHERRTIELLGDDWLLTPAGSDPPFTIRGIFAAAAATVLEEQGVGGVAVLHPTFRTMAADLGDAGVDDTLAHAELGSWRIAERPDPEQPSGRVLLALERA